MLNDWYVIRDGKDEGPFTGDELKAMCESGAVERGTLVRWKTLDRPKPAELSAAFNLLPTPPTPKPLPDPPRIVGTVIFSAFWGFVLYSTASMLWTVQSPALTLVALGAIAFLVVFVWTLGGGAREVSILTTAPTSTGRDHQGRTSS